MIENGSTVHVHYTGTLDDGTMFDSSRERDPLAFEIGAGQVIPGFDENIKGLSQGDTAKFRLEPAQAYGERRDDLVAAVPADNAPDGLSEGDQVQLQDGRRATVVDVGDDAVTIDANHPLAGKALTFDVEVVKVA
jgi:FKBP-type peptidyl-prolyl cis-trans isomerase 2